MSTKKGKPVKAAATNAPADPVLEQVSPLAVLLQRVEHGGTPRCPRLGATAFLASGTHPATSVGLRSGDEEAYAQGYELDITSAGHISGGGRAVVTLFGGVSFTPTAGRVCHTVVEDVDMHSGALLRLRMPTEVVPVDHRRDERLMGEKVRKMALKRAGRRAHEEPPHGHSQEVAAPPNVAAGRSQCAVAVVLPPAPPPMWMVMDSVWRIPGGDVILINPGTSRLNAQGAASHGNKESVKHPKAGALAPVNDPHAAQRKHEKGNKPAVGSASLLSLPALDAAAMRQGGVLEKLAKGQLSPRAQSQPQAPLLFCFDGWDGSSRVGGVRVLDLATTTWYHVTTGPASTPCSWASCPPVAKDTPSSSAADVAAAPKAGPAATLIPCDPPPARTFHTATWIPVKRSRPASGLGASHRRSTGTASVEMATRLPSGAVELPELPAYALSGHIAVFGGNSGSAQCDNTLHFLELATMTWRCTPPTAPPPSPQNSTSGPLPQGAPAIVVAPRSSHVAGLLMGRYLVIHGGRSGVWRADGGDTEAPSEKGKATGGKAALSLTYSASSMARVVGSPPGDTARVHADVAVFDTELLRWMPVMVVTAAQPAARYAHAAAVISLPPSLARGRNTASAASKRESALAGTDDATATDTEDLPEEDPGEEEGLLIHGGIGEKSETLDDAWVLTMTCKRVVPRRAGSPAAQAVTTRKSLAAHVAAKEAVRGGGSGTATTTAAPTVTPPTSVSSTHGSVVVCIRWTPLVPAEASSVAALPGRSGHAMVAAGWQVALLGGTDAHRGAVVDDHLMVLTEVQPNSCDKAEKKDR